MCKTPAACQRLNGLTSCRARSLLLSARRLLSMTTPFIRAAAVVAIRHSAGPYQSGCRRWYSRCGRELVAAKTCRRFEALPNQIETRRKDSHPGPNWDLFSTEPAGEQVEVTLPVIFIPYWARLLLLMNTAKAADGSYFVKRVDSFSGELC